VCVGLVVRIYSEAGTLSWYAFPGVDESSQSATSFPESATSFEDVIMHHVAHILREWNVGLESEHLPLSRNESL